MSLPESGSDLPPREHSLQAWRKALGSQAVLALPAPAPDFRIPYGDDPNQYGELRLPPAAGPRPVIVVVHGGFWRQRWDAGHIGHLAAALTGLGYATWSIEYRRLGQAGGGWPGTFLDAGRAVDALRTLAAQHPLDLESIAVVGHSAGGHLALWLAGRRRIDPASPLFAPGPLPVALAVSLAGVLDLRRAWELGLDNRVVEELLGGAPDRCPERYQAASPIERLPLGLPQVLLHGEQDQQVPLEISRRYTEKATALGETVALHVLPDAGHFDWIDPLSPAFEVFAGRLKAFLP